MNVRISRNRRCLIVAALLETALTPMAALAQDATWVGIGNNFNSSANWSPSVVPTGTATFGATGVTNPTNVGTTTLDRIVFDLNAQSYSFDNLTNLTINGIGSAGITNLSSNGQNLRNHGTMTFNNAAGIGGTGIVLLENISPGSGGTATLTFNDSSGLFGTAGMVSSAGYSALAVGTTDDAGGSAVTVFNDSSSADAVGMTFIGGNASALGDSGAHGTAIGGSGTATFNDNAHADNGTITNMGGTAVGVAGVAAGEVAVAVGGSGVLTFNDNSHADGTNLNTYDGGATAVASSMASSTAVAGTAQTVFHDASHADNAVIGTLGSGVTSVGGNGNPGTSGIGADGQQATSVGGAAMLTFDGTSHADGATILNAVNSAAGVGGAGGAGMAGTGGTGGTGYAIGASAVTTFAGSSHANGATIINAGANAISTGGSGGAGSATSAGGVGGAGFVLGGSAQFIVKGDVTLTGATISNGAGNATGTGGAGGVGGAVSTAAGGVGGTGEAQGGGAVVTFDDNAIAGAGTTITNIGGNGNATGGLGGKGGIGATGGVGGAGKATGGTATVQFLGHASAGSASITNTAGTATGISGGGGDGDVGDGGSGGYFATTAGAAEIVFSETATAGNATISNNAGVAISANAGAPGNPGTGGGSGGYAGGGSASSTAAIVRFEDNATGGGARITNNGATTSLMDNAIFGTAAGAQIINNTNGTTEFDDDASLGGGAIVNNAGGFTLFMGNSTAATGTIDNAADSFLAFYETSDAGAATITSELGSTTTFLDDASAGLATINNSGRTIFLNNADAIGARIINSGTGEVAISGIASNLKLGSLSGGGTVELGTRQLQVGYLGLADSFSGVILGDGSLVKQGTGTLILSGTNIYAGGTTIAGGTLQLGNGGTAGSVVGDITDNANLTFNRSDTVTFGNVISGSGSLTQAGAGTLILTNANTYGGGTTISAGTLQLGNGGTTGSILGDVVDNGNLAFDRSDAMTFAGVVSGTGTLTKLGANTLTLTGDNTYTGVTTILAGTLQVGDGGTSGAIAGDVAGSGALVFNRSDSVTYAGAISGTGTVTKLGAGTLTLTGNSTHTGLTTVSAGTLQIGDGGTTGSLAGDIADNAALAFNRSDNVSYSGEISGTGTLTKLGAGTLTLTGDSTYTGATAVNAGALQLDGSVTSNVTVGAAGTLTGTGTITGALITDGTVAPGNAAAPTGTLTVTGDAAFHTGSALQPTVTAAGAGSLLNAGSLTLGGGEVRPVAASGGTFLMQTDYVIASGSGGRTGNFTGIDASMLPTFLDATLAYSGADVTLRLRRASTDFAGASGLTANEGAFAAALDAAVAGGGDLPFTTYVDLYNGLLTASGPGALAAQLNTASGDALTAFPAAEQNAALRFSDRLAAQTWSNSSNLWGLVAYGDQDVDGDGNGPGFKADGFEAQIGFATSLGENTRLGLSLGMTNGDVDVDDRAANGEVDTWSAGVRLRHDFGGFYLAGQGTYSQHDVDTERALLGGSTASGEFDAHTWTAEAEAGAVLAAGAFSFEPFASFRHASTRQDGYSESGPAGALDVAAETFASSRIGAGLRLANRNPASMVRPWVQISYERELADEVVVLDNALPGLPSFQITGTELGKDIFLADWGIAVGLGKAVSLFAGGGAHFRSNETSLQLYGGLRVKF